MKDEILLSLIKASKSYIRKKPWEILNSNDIFGFIDPITKKKYFCSVLGQQNLLRGFHIYVGEEGILHCFDAGNPFCVDAAYQQDLISFTQGSRDELFDDEDDAYLRLSLTFAKDKCSIFHRYQPGYQPFVYYEEDARILMLGYDMIKLLMKKLKEDVLFYQDIYQGNDLLIPVFEFKEDGWQCKIENLKNYHATIEIQPIEAIISREVKALPQEGTWEIGLFYLPTALPSKLPYRFYFPLTLILYDNDEKEIISMIMKNENQDLSSILERFVDLLLEEGCIPEKLIFRNPSCAALFSGIDDCLNCEVSASFERSSVLDDVWKGYAVFTSRPKGLKN